MENLWAVWGRHISQDISPCPKKWTCPLALPACNKTSAGGMCFLGISGWRPCVSPQLKTLHHRDLGIFPIIFEFSPHLRKNPIENPTDPSDWQLLQVEHPSWWASFKTSFLMCCKYIGSSMPHQLNGLQRVKCSPNVYLFKPHHHVCPVAPQWHNRRTPGHQVTKAHETRPARWSWHRPWGWHQMRTCWWPLRYEILRWHQVLKGSRALIFSTAPYEFFILLLGPLLIFFIIFVSM